MGNFVGTFAGVWLALWIICGAISGGMVIGKICPTPISEAPIIACEEIKGSVVQTLLFGPIQLGRALQANH